MCEADGYNEALFTAIRLEEFVPANHPLRPIRNGLNEALTQMGEFDPETGAQTKSAHPEMNVGP